MIDIDSFTFNEIRIDSFNYGKIIDTRIYNKEEFEKAKKFFNKHFNCDNVALVVTIDGKRLSYDDSYKLFDQKKYNHRLLF